MMHTPHPRLAQTSRTAFNGYYFFFSFIIRLLSSKKSARLQLRLPKHKWGQNGGNDDAYLLTYFGKNPRDGVSLWIFSLFCDCFIRALGGRTKGGFRVRVFLSYSGQRYDIKWILRLLFCACCLVHTSRVWFSLFGDCFLRPASDRQVLSVSHCLVTFVVLPSALASRRILRPLMRMCDPASPLFESLVRV